MTVHGMHVVVPIEGVGCGAHDEGCVGRSVGLGPGPEPGEDLLDHLVGQAAAGARALIPFDSVRRVLRVDAGDVAQLTYLRPDGLYDLLPPRQAGFRADRQTFGPDFRGAPAGGAVMYFYLRDEGGG